MEWHNSRSIKSHKNYCSVCPTFASLITDFYDNDITLYSLFFFPLSRVLFLFLCVFFFRLSSGTGLTTIPVNFMAASDIWTRWKWYFFAQHHRSFSNRMVYTQLSQFDIFFRCLVFFAISLFFCAVIGYSLSYWAIYLYTFSFHQSFLIDLLTENFFIAGVMELLQCHYLFHSPDGFLFRSRAK